MVYIEGPNSSGKSTLLNIIALGLLGAKSGKMNPILIKRMNSLLNSEYQKVKFQIKISSENESLFLRSRKNDPNRSEIILEESTDGKTYKPISFETFESRYNLIYDIPNNPTERLYDLIEELKEEQLRYGSRFKEFCWFLRDTIKEITQHRDPKRLKELKERLKQAIQKRERFIRELPELQNFLDLLEKRAYVKYYYYYLNECTRLEFAKREIEEKIRRFDISGRKLSSRIGKLKKEIAALQGELSENYYEVTPLIENLLPKKERHRFEIWKGINPYNTSDNELNRIRVEAIHLMNLFGSEIESLQSKGSFRDANVLEKMIQSLKEFENSSIMIPKIRVTVKELIEILKDESKKNYLLISKYENLVETVGLLKNLNNKLDMLWDSLKEIWEISAKSTKLTEGYPESLYEQSQLRNLREELNKAIEKCDHYLHKCLSKNMDRKLLEQSSFMETIRTLPEKEELTPFLSLNERQIEAKISELEEDVAGKRTEIESLKVYIDQYEKEKERLEKQKPHKYEAYQAQLKDLLQKNEAISQKLLQEYNSNIRNLVEKKVRKDDIEKEESKRRFYEEVSKYLAHRIGFFKHIETNYKAKIVDLISGVIVTDNDLTIHLADMGTGQSQSAYLLGLLNVKNDERKIIALFDEIAMMDDSSLEPIYDKMRSLHKEKRLLLGMLVQKGNKINIRSLG